MPRPAQIAVLLAAMLWLAAALATIGFKGARILEVGRNGVSNHMSDLAMPLEAISALVVLILAWRWRTRGLWLAALFAIVATALLTLDLYANACYALVDYELWLSLGMPERRC